MLADPSQVLLTSTMPVLTCSTWRASKASNFSLWISFLTLWGTSGTKKARNPAITMIRCYKRNRHMTGDDNHMTVRWQSHDCVMTIIWLCDDNDIQVQTSIVLWCRVCTSKIMTNASRAVCSCQYLRLCSVSWSGLKPRNLYVCVCVRACVCVCVCVCACVCVWVCVCVWRAHRITLGDLAGHTSHAFTTHSEEPHCTCRWCSDSTFPGSKAAEYHQYSC